MVPGRQPCRPAHKRFVCRGCASLSCARTAQASPGSSFLQPRAAATTVAAAPWLKVFSASNWGFQFAGWELGHLRSRLPDRLGTFPSLLLPGWLGMNQTASQAVSIEGKVTTPLKLCRLELCCQYSSWENAAPGADDCSQDTSSCAQYSHRQSCRLFTPGLGLFQMGRHCRCHWKSATDGSLTI